MSFSRESDRLINDFRKKRRKTDEDLEVIATSGIEMDSGLWTVKLWLQGHQDYLLLPISAADKRRFYYYFQEKPPQTQSASSFLILPSIVMR